MKNYINRLKDGCPTRRFIFWWIFRALMIYAFIAGFFKKPFDITDPLQVGANLLGMFAWEIFMLFPKKSVCRYIPSVVQSFLVIGLFAASFGGKFLNLYYDFRWWDVILHFLGGGAAVFFGYELCAALQKRDKAAAPLSIILLCSAGFSFFASTCWELFEFTFDQISCMGGGMGDSQHWSIELAQGTPKMQTLFDPVYADRWPLMDTMADIVLNSLGALVSFIYIKINPYRHKGKNDITPLLHAEKEESSIN